MPKNELFSLMNVGPATYKDLQILEITSIEKLSKADPDELYSRLQEITGHPHDRRCTLWTGQKLGLFKLVFVPELC